MSPAQRSGAASGSEYRSASGKQKRGSARLARRSFCPGASRTSARMSVRRRLARAHPLRRLAEHVAEDGDDLVELLLLCDERRRDLDDGVAAVVRPADEPALEEPWGEK